MFAKRIAFAAGLGLLLSVSALKSPAQDEKPAKVVWTDVNDPTLPFDFKFQGEFAGTIQSGRKAVSDPIGCQVIDLGQHRFQAVILPGGLPGAGWDGKNKIILSGKLDGKNVNLTPATGNRKYLAQNPDEFSATAKFPPDGQKEFTAAILLNGTIAGQSKDGNAFVLKKVERKSPTLGLKAPSGAVVLFDGTGTDAWKGGRLDKATGFLNTDGHDIVSKKNFMNYTAHLEFMLPYRPSARGQGRGNSGFYQVNHYEVQILDSFGLEGLDNECGGFYTKVKPKLNMCLPPLVWQTYDIDFTNAVRENDKVVKKARATLKHNGVVIHDDVEIGGPTGGHRSDPEGTPGPILLQGHGNPLQFRNIWIVEKK